MQLTQEKKIVSRDQEVVFTNWTDKEFEGLWVEGPTKQDKIVHRKIYRLKAGKSYYIPFYLAEKFAKEISDREYWSAFNKKLEELRGQPGANLLDRRQLEHRVQNDNDIRKLNRQEMMDKCVEIPTTEEKVETVRPNEVRMKEVMLARDERAVSLRERFPGISLEGVNEKAIQQSKSEEDQFEEEIK